MVLLLHLCIVAVKVLLRQIEVSSSHGLLWEELMSALGHAIRSSVLDCSEL